MALIRRTLRREVAITRVGFHAQVFCIWVLLGWIAMGGTVASAQWTEIYVPEEISEWSQWVAEGLPDDYWCPWEEGDGNKMSCVWPLNLSIDLHTSDAETIATFTLEVQLFDEADIGLPHNDDGDFNPPYEVRLDGQPAIVGQSERIPAVTAPAGRHTVTGKIRWPEFPTSLELPPGIVRLSLTQDGERVRRPTIQGSRVLLQQDSTTESEADSLSIRVYRRLEDGIPQLLTTRLELSVAGSSRQVDLGSVLPSGFALLSVYSEIPARTNANGELSVLVRPGWWAVELEARAVSHLSEFSMVHPNEVWPLMELWGVETDENVRSVRMEGVPPTDLSQTESPFSGLAGFVLKQGETLKLVEVSRGDTSPDFERAEVVRRLWLGFEGDRWVVHDTLDASLHRESRLSAKYPLGRVTVNERPTLISTLESTPDGSGVAVPKGDVEIDAVSEFLSGGRLIFHKIPAVGWKVDAASLAVSAKLPPQWLALWAGGADRVNGTWVHSWTLWDVFLIALLVVITIRVAGPRWAIVLGLTSVLLFVYNGVPVVGWLVLVAIGALSAALTSQVARLWIGRVYWLVAIPVFAVSAYTSVSFVLNALYPQFDVERSLTQVAKHRDLGESIDSDGTGDIGPGDDTAGWEGEEHLAVTGSRIARDVLTSIATAQGSSRVTMGKTEESIGNPVWVQTGPGMPAWPKEGITELDLVWLGPVGPEQDFSLLLLPPAATRFASLLTAALILVVLWMFVRIRLRPGAANPSDRGGAKLLPLVLAVVLVPDAFADVPSNEILEELDERFRSEPACLPNCSTVEVVKLSCSKDELELELTFHIDSQSGEGIVSKFGVPLPIVEPSIRPTSAVLGDGQQPLLDRYGEFYVPLDRGIHRVQLRYDLEGLDRIDIYFPDRPARVVTGELGRWRFVSHPDRLESLESLSLTREPIAMHSKKEKEWGSTEATLAPYARVSRHLNLTREPTIKTTVTRSSIAARSPIEIVLSLLEGEIVTDELVENDGVHMKIRLDSGEDRFVLNSRLNPSKSISMTAAVDVPWAESWSFRPSDFWHLSYAGLAPVKSKGSVTLFKPRPGESLQVTLSQPKPVAGNSVTVTSAKMATAVSSRYRESSLALEVLASLGDTARVLLPEGATVKRIEINGSPKPVPQSNVVSLPIDPGKGRFRVDWLDQVSLGSDFRGPSIEVSTPLRNVHNSVDFPSNRWVLLIGGPGMGPGILTWGIILVVIAVSIALTRIPNFPLRPVDAVLLSLGVTLANLEIVLLLAVWFLAIWYRREHPPSPTKSERYIATQCLFALLSLVAILALVVSVPRALLGRPEMEVFGLGSSAHEFFWFNDSTDGSLPVPWIFSLPLWVYHVLMVGWGFWLAFALVRWVRTAWAVMSQPVLWPKWRKKQAPATEA